MAMTKSITRKPEPTYTVAELFPPQGQWTDQEYLSLNTNRLIELSDGNLEVLEMPTPFHQLVVVRLITALYTFVTQHRLGHVLVAPLRVRLWPGRFREPDLVFMSAAHADRITSKYWGVPDLAVEVISLDDPDRDRIAKKAEYAQAGIPEYWILDPEEKTLEVYLLPAEEEEYQLSQTLGIHDSLASAQLPGFELILAELFAEE